MKPTIQQQDFLRDYLRKNLRYSETYIEFYDHILSSLDSKPLDMSFQDAVDEIVKEDFGGYNGMSTIESNYKKKITNEVRSRYKTYLMECFKFPLIGATLTLAVVFYWMTKQPWFGWGTFLVILFSMRLIPRLLRHARNIISGYILTRPKRSVKDPAFDWLDYLPVILLIIFMIPSALNTPSPQLWYNSASPVCLTFILLAFAIHALTYFRIYKNEFKTTLISQ